MRRPTPHDDALADALRSALDATGGAVSEHPSEAELAAYLARDLDADRIERLERHLAGCAGCSEDLITATAVEDDVLAQSERIAEPVATRPASVRPAPVSLVQARRPASVSAPRVKHGRSWLRIAASVTIVFGALAIAAAAGSRVLLGTLQPVLLGGMGNVLSRKVSGSGTEIVLAGGPGLRMDDIEIAEDPQFGDDSFAQVRGATLRVDPGALLRGQVRGDVQLDEPRVHLQRDERGRWNVESLSGKDIASAAVRDGVSIPTTKGPRSAKERALRLTSASVAHGVLEISDKKGKGDVTMRNVDLSYRSSDPQAPAAVTLAGTVGSDTQRIALRGEIGPFEGNGEPRYRFDEVVLQSLPLSSIPGAPQDLRGDLTFRGKLSSTGSGLEDVVHNASGEGDLGVCCGELRQRNLTAELVTALTHGDGDAATVADVLARARRTPALASVLALDGTPFEDISGAVAIADGTVTFQGLAVDTSLFQASAMGSLSRAGAMEAQGTVTLTPAATAAIAELLPATRRLINAGTKLEVPFSVAGNWPDVKVHVDVRSAIARLTAPLDPRSLRLLPRIAG